MLQANFLFQKQDSLYSVKKESLTCLKTESRYTTIYSTKGKFLTQQSLTKWRALLPEDEFVQINRNTLIKLDCIEQLVLKDNLLTLTDNTSHTIGRQYKLELLKSFIKVI